MLNLGGNPNNEDDSSTNGQTATINIGTLGPQVHQVHNSNGSTSFVYEYYKAPDKDSLQWR